MESREGRGIALGRWSTWVDSLPDDFKEAMGLDIHSTRLRPGTVFDAKVWEQIAKDLRERSELVGFWIAWHEAGGFDGLERTGWNRATIYRKLRRFRAVFDEHPDEADFGWITLNLPKLWLESTDATIGEAPEPAKRKRK